MASAWWIIQFIVSLFACFGLYLVLKTAWEEGVWERSLLALLFPLYLLFYVGTRWQKCKVPALVGLVCVTIAALAQRARLGYWAWPDVGL